MRRERHAMELSTRIGPVVLKNPVMPAAGTFGWVREFAAFYDPSLLGAVIPKTITLEPREGNPPQRAVETPAGMLNAIGLQNPGFEVFRKEHWPYIRSLDTVRIVNVAGETVDEFVRCAEAVSSLEGVDMIELNTSCPNVRRDGAVFGATPERVAEVVRAVKNAVDIPLITKLSPNAADITAVAEAAESAGSAAVSLTNTFLGMAVDTAAARPVLANVRGGLSGPAIKPLSLRMVYDTAGKVKIPVIGVGGISTGEDALEFLMAGACAVQAGTANLVDAYACKRIVEELADALRAHGYGSVEEVIGKARTA